MTNRSPSFEIALIVPCYNEERRLPVKDYADLIKFNPRVIFVFVNDGSTDNTLACLHRLKSEFPENVEVVSLDRNLGKAEAVRQGTLYAHKSSKYDLLGYWDADLATPLTELPLFLDVFQQRQECKFVSGARILRMGSDISRHWYRHYLGRVFATGASFALSLPYYDTQCGAKVFRNENIDVLFGGAFSSRWLFDVELIFRLKNSVPSNNYQAVFHEVPLKSWQDVPGSKLSAREACTAPYELYKVWRRYR